MTDWKSDVDAFMPDFIRYNQRRAEEHAQRAHGEARVRVANTFKCHTAGCTVRGIPPAEKIDSDGYPIEDWERPNNLYSCTVCKKDMCAEHLHQGVCRGCWQKRMREVAESIPI